MGRCFQTNSLKLCLGQGDRVAELEHQKPKYRTGVTTTGQPPDSSRSSHPSLLTTLTSEETQLKHHIVDPDLHSKTILRVCCKSLTAHVPSVFESSSAASTLSVCPEAEWCSRLPG